MCGITGVMQFGSTRVEPETLRRMCAAMVHRGPDDEGIYTAGSVGIGMRRLSIVDLLLVIGEWGGGEIHRFAKR